jgi:hypothetical protein
MTHLGFLPCALLLPLLLAACPGKDGLLTDHGGDDSSTTDSAASTTGTASDTGLDTGETTTTDATTSSNSETTVATSTGPLTTGETTGETTGGTTGGDFSGDAAIYNDCAPNDGFAFRIEVGVSSATCNALWPTADKLTIAVYVMPPAAPGKYEVVSPDLGHALLDNGDGSPQSATAGFVLIDSWQADQASGSYDLTFEGGLHLTGDFAGPYCGGPFSCS